MAEPSAFLDLSGDEQDLLLLGDEHQLRSVPVACDSLSSEADMLGMDSHEVVTGSFIILSDFCSTREEVCQPQVSQEGEGLQLREQESEATKAKSETFASW